jgi:hypothetical protein
MLRRECGVTKALTRPKIKTLAAEVTEDFLDVFFR